MAQHTREAVSKAVRMLSGLKGIKRLGRPAAWAYLLDKVLLVNAFPPQNNRKTGRKEDRKTRLFTTDETQEITTYHLTARTDFTRQA